MEQRSRKTKQQLREQQRESWNSNHNLTLLLAICFGLGAWNWSRRIFHASHWLQIMRLFYWDGSVGHRWAAYTHSEKIMTIIRWERKFSCAKCFLKNSRRTSPINPLNGRRVLLCGWRPIFHFDAGAEETLDMERKIIMRYALWLRTQEENFSFFLSPLRHLFMASFINLYFRLCFNVEQPRL